MQHAEGKLGPDQPISRVVGDEVCTGLYARSGTAPSRILRFVRFIDHAGPGLVEPARRELRGYLHVSRFTVSRI